MNNRGDVLIQRIRREESRNPDLPVYVPGEDPGEFGRRVARQVFEKYVKNAEVEPSVSRTRTG